MNAKIKKVEQSQSLSVEVEARTLMQTFRYSRVQVTTVQLLDGMLHLVPKFSVFYQRLTSYFFALTYRCGCKSFHSGVFFHNIFVTKI